MIVSAPDAPVIVLLLRTEMLRESSPAPAAIELPATVRAATTVSLPPAATTVLPVRPRLSDSESAPSAKETVFAFAAALNTIVSFAVSAVPPSEAPATEAPSTKLLKVSRSAPLPPTRVELDNVPVTETRSSPWPPCRYVPVTPAVMLTVSFPLFASTRAFVSVSRSWMLSSPLPP